MDSLRVQINQYLDLPLAERLITTIPDLRQVEKKLRDYTQGLQDTPYLTRSLADVMDPDNHRKLSISFHSSPQDPAVYGRDWRLLIKDVISGHCPEPWMLGHGWVAPPAESFILRHLDQGDQRMGFIHWSALREQRVAIRMQGPWNSVDHGYRVVVINFGTGEISFQKREFAKIETDMLGIVPDEVPPPALLAAPEADDSAQHGSCNQQGALVLEATLGAEIWEEQLEKDFASLPELSAESEAQLEAAFQEADDIDAFLQTHPDLFNGHFYPPDGIEKIPGAQLTVPEREFLFVESIPAHLKVSYQLPPSFRRRLAAYPTVGYSEDEPMEVQAKKLRSVIPIDEFRKIPVSITDLSNPEHPTTTVYRQRELAVADVAEEERVITLSPQWLSVLKSVLWPKSMIGISTAVYSPYETEYMQLHTLKPHETSPMTSIEPEYLHEQHHADEIDHLLESMRDVPDLEDIDPELSKELENLIRSPNFDLPPIDISQGSLHPFDNDALNDDPENEEGHRWRMFHFAQEHITKNSKE